MSCEECLKRQKKMRVMLSDHSFQLRKISEDKAEEKVLYEISAQKQLRKWQEKYSKQKLDHEQNSKKWLNKIDEIKTACQLQVLQIKKQTQKQNSQQKEEAIITLEAEKAIIFNNHQKELEQIKEIHSTQKIASKNTFRTQIVTLQQRLLDEIQRIKQQAKQKQHSLIREYESTILGLKSGIIAEQKQNLRLHEQQRLERGKYLSQIYDNKVKMSSFQESINRLKTNLTVKEHELLQAKTQIEKLCEQHRIEIAVAEKEQEGLKRQFQQCLQNQLRQFFEKELQITQQYEGQVKKIQEKREHEQKLYQTNLNQVRLCIQSRLSRVEDVQEILILRQKLVKKERDYESLQKEAKHIQLQLQNKEDTYNKIFIPSISSSHLNDSSTIKRKELKLKRPGKSLSTVRDILVAANINTNNLPTLNNIDKKYLPPKSTKIL